ncbi:MAG: hypothetical protein SFY66_19670 [Oculatellaceae cyanobacterium bins.114]|nr:hypothetical protein [Oculatellaceae cyanobacterium bins.114]
MVSTPIKISTEEDEKRGSGRLQPQNFRTPTGLCIQFIQQHLDRPVWDVSVTFPVARFLGKIEHARSGWKIVSVNRQPHADMVSHPSYEEAAIALLDLCRKPASLPDASKTAHEVVLTHPRKSKVLIVVLTATDAATDVFREIQNQLSIRRLNGYSIASLKLLSDPF